MAGGIVKVGGVWRWGIARLNADGTLDPSFDPGDGANGTIYAVALQPDGKVLVGGSFSTFAGVARSRIARLNSDGTFDTNFVKMANSSVNSVAAQHADKILAGGTFAQISDRGSAWYSTNYHAFMRLDSEGNVDASFRMGNGTEAIESPPFNWVKTLLIIGDRAVIGGDFTHYQGVRRRRLAQIQLEDQAPLELEHIRLSGGGKTLSWIYYPETDYSVGDPVVHLQAATDMASGNWTTILQTNLGAVARAIELSSGDTNATPVLRYYRLRRQ